MHPHLRTHRPLVAILRGLPATDAAAIGRALFEGGWRLLEVPLNREGALTCIRTLAAMAPADAIVGGGTVLEVADVDAVHAAGGRLVVAPNCRPAVIERAVGLGMLCAPGVGTASEAFDALRCGAQALKLFPAEVWGPRGLKALKSVLPEGTPLWPVGGVAPDDVAAWVQAGATGLGLGSQLYRPGDDAHALRVRADAFVAAWDAAQPAAAQRKGAGP